MQLGDKDYIDYQDGLKRVGGNDALYKRLLGVFADGNHLAPIDTAVSDGDYAEAARAAHTLKGVSANLSLTALYSAAVELEACFKQALDHANCLEELRTVYTATMDRITGE